MVEIVRNAAADLFAMDARIAANVNSNGKRVLSKLK
jgi:hypothetical protein